MTTPTFNLLSNQGRTWGEGSITDIRGTSGLGFYRLSLDVRFHIEAAEQTLAERLVGLYANVQVLPGTLGRMEVLPYQLPITQASYSTTFQAVLEMDLDLFRLEAVENTRQGGDLSLALVMHAILQDQAGNTRFAQQGLVYDVNQGVWVRVLEAMGYQKRMLLEVPVPDGQAPAELRDALNHLARAQDAMARGDYRDSVACCRDVIERIDGAFKLSIDHAVFDRVREKSKADRIKLILHGLKSFTHPAKHSDDAAIAMEWNRLDASFAITVISALISELAAPGAR